MEFIEDRKEQISQSFSEWLVVLNDGFDEFKIYDNRKSLGSNSQLNFDFSEETNAEADEESNEEAGAEAKNPSYSKSFEPDFIFFGKSKGKEDSPLLSIECFMEVKGKHLMNDDNNWKEEFLECLQGAYTIGKSSSENLRVPFLPFFIVNENKRFKDEFAKLLQSRFGD